MTEQIIVGVAIAAIIAGIGFILHLIKKLFRKIELSFIKHDGLVYALSKWSENGFMKDYKDYVDRYIKEAEHIEK